MDKPFSFLPPLSIGAPRAARDAGTQRTEIVPLRRIELFFVWGFWGFIALLTFINALVNDRVADGPRLPAMAPLVAALIDGGIWAVLTPLLFRMTSRYNLERPRWVFSLLLQLIVGIALSICVSRFMSWVRYEQAVHYIQTLPAPSSANFDPDSVLRRFWFMNEFVIYLVIMAAGYAHHYFVRYRVRQEEASALQAQTAHLRAELADSRLNTLRTQLNPHFLFNTLNAVSSLVEYDPRGAQRMIVRLSDLLRDTLSASELEVPLERELVFVRRYIDIMQTRFRDRLEAVESIAPETLPALVPNLILQPLVENAIKHGIDKLDSIGRIEIRAERAGDMLRLSVLDNGLVDSDTRFQDHFGSGGLGLKNTQARLTQSYGEKQSLRLRGNAGGGVIAEILLPFHLHAGAKARAV